MLLHKWTICTHISWLLSSGIHSVKCLIHTSVFYIQYTNITSQHCKYLLPALLAEKAELEANEKITDFKKEIWCQFFKIAFIFLSWLFLPFPHKSTNCGACVYFGHHHNNSMWALTQPHNDFPFSLLLFLCHWTVPGRYKAGWPQRSNSGLVVVLGPSPGFQARSPLQILFFFPPFHPSFHWCNKTAPLLCTEIVETAPHCTPN